MMDPTGLLLIIIGIVTLLVVLYHLVWSIRQHSPRIRIEINWPFKAKNQTLERWIREEIGLTVWVTSRFSRTIYLYGYGVYPPKRSKKPGVPPYCLKDWGPNSYASDGESIPLLPGGKCDLEVEFNSFYQNPWYGKLKYLTIYSEDHHEFRIRIPKEFPSRVKEVMDEAGIDPWWKHMARVKERLESNAKTINECSRS